MQSIHSTISYLINRLSSLQVLPVIFSSLLMTQCGIAQLSKPAGLCENPEFDKEVSKWIRQSVPVIGAQELYNKLDAHPRDLYLLDARDKKEYEVSHLPGAIRVGYDDFSKDRIQQIPKDAEVIVYCSIGYRSEKVGEKLRKMGYSHVENLYGSIFDWANRDYPLVNTQGDTTHSVHTYNKKWGQWVNENHAKKVW